MMTARSEFAEELDDEAMAASARSHQGTVAAASNRPYQWIAVSSATVAVTSGSAGSASGRHRIGRPRGHDDAFATRG